MSKTEKPLTGAAEPPKEPAETMLTTAEAAKRLGVTVRHFRKMRSARGTIPGAQLVNGEWAFPASAVDALDDGDDDDAPLTMQDASARLLQELLKASKELHVSVANAMKEGQASAGLAMTAAVKTIEGTDARTKLLIEEMTRQGEASARAQAQSIETFSLMKDLILGMAEVEASKIKADADQTIRVERIKVASRGVQLFAPIVKAGLARARGAPALARDAQSETVLEVIQGLEKSPEKLARLSEILDQEQLAAVGFLIDYANGHKMLPAALKTLKSRMMPEQLAALSGVLNQEQLAAVASLFEAADDDDPKPGARPGANGAAAKEATT